MHSSGDIAGLFRRICKASPEKSEALAAIDVLTRVLHDSHVSTVQGLHDVLNTAILEMTEADHTYLCVKSACELFQRFITLTISDAPDDFNRCKQVLQERADMFLRKIGACKRQIAENFLNLLPDGGCILVHSYSRVVLSALEAYAASKSNMSATSNLSSSRLHCYVTTCAPHESGRKMTKELARLKIPCTLIPDLSIGYLMPRVSLVLMGAHAVVESGGVLNDLGSSTVAMIAAAFGKPVYVLAESFKFIRAFPLDQHHIPSELKYSSGISPACSPLRNLKMTDALEEDEVEDAEDDFPELHTAWARVNEHRVQTIERTMPITDYTNPFYISYLVTDLGVLTPSVVSDELIKLYL